MNDRPPPERPNPDFDKARALPTLAARLDAYREAAKRRRPALAEANQHLIERLIRVGAGGGAPREGDTLPPFLLPDENGHLVSSAELLARGPLIVSFNRGSWCPFCWLELAALNDTLPAIAAKGGRILSITPEVATYSRRLKEHLGLDFPVLSDIDNAYALELGITTALSAEARREILALGADLGIFQNNDAWFVPIPATLAVRRGGRIARAYVNPEFRERIEPAALLDSLD